ncbi:MAG TPA: hypothetical protein ENN81_02110 [Phycisphaerales bacterium]|nr:hypothetical protein [Phycisphaerales bacterium]
MKTWLLARVLFAAWFNICVSASFPEQTPCLSNPFMSIEFHMPEKGGAIRRIRNETGFEFLNRDGPGSLWQIELKRIPPTSGGTAGIQRLSLDPEVNDGMARRTDLRSRSDVIVLRSDRVAADCRIETKPDGFTMFWKDITVDAEKAVLDVYMTVTLAQNDEFVRFRAGFANRSRRYTVFYLTAPIVGGIYPADDRTDLDRLASPVYNGRLTFDPIRNGILGEPYRFQPNRSGHSMQFDAYYHGDNGLYLGCFDGDQNVKRYYLAADKTQGLSWGTVHIPDNMKSVPQLWSVPYDVVLRCFKGDWYDACRIYRAWALKQSWASQGPLHRRTNTPTWFKEIHMWMRWGGPTLSPSLQKHPYHPNIRDALDGLSKGLHLHYWGKGHLGTRGSPDLFPLDAQDRHTLDLARQHNYPIMGFIQAVCWDSESESFKRARGEDEAVHNFYGQRLLWELGKPGDRTYTRASVAFPGDVWTEELGDVVVQMAQAGFRAAYMDSFNHGGTYLNFNPRYGEQVGGGNTYIKYNQRMLQTIKARVRAVDPDFCFSGESFWEGNIAELDGFLTCNTTYQPLKGKQIIAIPMIQSVYHDYTICFGAWASRWDLETDNGLGYLAKSAQAFTWGVKSGWVEPLLLTNHKAAPLAIETVQRRGRAYASAVKFLVYGEMLREPRITSHMPELDVKWYIRWTTDYYTVTMPAVLSSLWRAPDGRLGLVLYNISDRDTSMSLLLDDPDYGLRQADALRITALYPAHGEAGGWMPLRGPSIALRLVVPARSPAVFDIELRRPSDTVAEPSEDRERAIP